MNERILNALTELNAAIREVEPTAKVVEVKVGWKTGKRGRINVGGELAQLLAWRLEGSSLLRDVNRIARALYGE